jgi:hypothetical protein
MKKIIASIVAVLLIWFIWDAVSQPGVQDLSGNFEEEAFYRNENNTGPIIRIYAVSAEDTLWHEMRQYGNYMPHNKYGNTKVFFFLKGKAVPGKIYPGAENFNKELKEYCLAVYEKDAMGNVTFRRQPFL